MARDCQDSFTQSTLLVWDGLRYWRFSANRNLIPPDSLPTCYLSACLRSGLAAHIVPKRKKKIHVILSAMQIYLLLKDGMRILLSNYIYIKPLTHFWALFSMLHKADMWFTDTWFHVIWVLFLKFLLEESFPPNQWTSLRKWCHNVTSFSGKSPFLFWYMNITSPNSVFWQVSLRQIPHFIFNQISTRNQFSNVFLFIILESWSHFLVCLKIK